MLAAIVSVSANYAGVGISVGVNVGTGANVGVALVFVLASVSYWCCIGVHAD
jgi:hypothetical protein